MILGGPRCGRVPPRTRARLLAAARAAQPTYDHVGDTLEDAAGGRTVAAVVGTGAAAFEAARAALRAWVPQRALGADVEPPGQPVEPGATVLLVLRRGPFSVVAPNRVVAVVDEPRRYAYVYGTLPGHPERGEESFTVEHRPDGAVLATIRVRARPGPPLARLAAPAVRRIQAAALRRYLAAIAAHVQRRLT